MRKIVFSILSIIFIGAAIILGQKWNKNDLIRVTSPSAGEIVTSPLIILGEARGTWYFESTFPILLINDDGKVLGYHYGQAQGEWMTEDFVPFKSQLEFNVYIRTPATLILQKDNPSGLPEHDDEIRIPLILEPNI